MQQLCQKCREYVYSTEGCSIFVQEDDGIRNFHRLYYICGRCRYDFVELVTIFFGERNGFA